MGPRTSGEGRGWSPADRRQKLRLSWDGEGSTVLLGCGKGSSCNLGRCSPRKMAQERGGLGSGSGPGLGCWMSTEESICSWREARGWKELWDRGGQKPD